ncbi:DgyrCDS10626 [Dimorphilus gyrociliatus]|uniref:DgyrCDS10626 n=1 Tax=Dimorphilus gyrociliatus TaxID=2664684 RepID=A0A7I8W0T6_9ANNE|nr:DgyrCDS10626 [Dimorphilus gyrociliatus]
MMTFTVKKPEQTIDPDLLTKIERNTSLQYNELKRLNELNERMNSTIEDTESSDDSEDDSDYIDSADEKEISGDELQDLEKHTDYDLPGFRKRPDYYNDNMNESPSEFKRHVEYLEKMSANRSKELRYGNGEI